MNTDEIEAGKAYAGADGEIRMVVRVRAPDRGGQVVEYRRSGGAPCETMGLRGFARWALRQLGKRAEEPLRTGIAGDVAAAIRELRQNGMNRDQLTVFAVGMFTTRYGLPAAVARAAWIRRVVAREATCPP